MRGQGEQLQFRVEPWEGGHGEWQSRRAEGQLLRQPNPGQPSCQRSAYVGVPILLQVRACTWNNSLLKHHGCGAGLMDDTSPCGTVRGLRIIAVAVHAGCRKNCFVKMLAPRLCSAKS